MTTLRHAIKVAASRAATYRALTDIAEMAAWHLGNVEGAIAPGQVMTYIGDLDMIFVPGVAGHVLDPTQTPDYDPRITAKGTTTKTIFDCTVPFHLKQHFVRARFKDVDARLWAPSLFSRTPE